MPPMQGKVRGSGSSWHWEAVLLLYRAFPKRPLWVFGFEWASMLLEDNHLILRACTNLTCSGDQCNGHHVPGFGLLVS